MRFKIHLLITLSLCLSAFQGLYSQEGRDLEDLRSYIGNARELFDVPGISVGIVKNGKVILNEGFGTANVNTGAPVNSQTIFGIASCSKAFTAASLAMLVQDSLIRWDDRVVDLYPDFMLSDSCATEEMQVRDLVCHRSGLQTFDGDLLWYGTDYSREEVVKRIRYRDLSYSFRTQFGYQNVMFIAAGQLIEKVTGTSWDEFVNSRILTPLGMSSTTTTNRDFNEGMNLAQPHVDGIAEDFINYDNCGPAASLNTCTDDLLKWVTLWLNKGQSGDTRLFTEEQYYRMTAPQTLMNAGKADKPGGQHFLAYGMGWFMFDFEGRKVIEHGGGLPGFHSKVVFVPEDSLGFVIMANQISGLVEAVYKKILDHFLGEGQTDWAKLYRDYEIRKKDLAEKEEKEKEDQRDGSVKPTLNLQSYAGTYEDTMYGKARVEYKGGTLTVALLPTAELFTSELEHWEKDTFKITFKDSYLPSGYLSFHIDEENRPGSFTIDLENPDFHFYKLDFKKID